MKPRPELQDQDDRFLYQPEDRLLRVEFAPKVPINLRVNRQKAVSLLHDLGVAESTIELTAIEIDANDRLFLKASLSFPWFRRTIESIFSRHGSEQPPQPTIKIGTKIRGQTRSLDELNTSFAHEAAHMAQFENRPGVVALGWLAMASSTLLGWAVGNKIGNNRGEKTAVGLFGAVVGYNIGYWLAPHEREARFFAEHFSDEVFTYSPDITTTP